VSRRRARSRRTPKHLWIVGIAGLLWNAGGAYDYFMTESRNADYLAAFSPGMIEHVSNFPSWAVAAWAIAVWGAVLGSLLLLLRKAWAVPVFMLSLAGLVVTTGYRYGMSNGLEVAGEPFQLGFAAAIFVVTIALYLYARKMREEEVLT
jgi:hypothetical protein